MAEHEARLHAADHLDQTELVVLRQVQRVVAQIELDQVMHAERLRRLFGFGAAGGFHLFQRHAGVFPELRAFTALAEGQADDGDVIAFLGMQGDGAAATPDEIGGMGADDERGLGLWHGVLRIAAGRLSQGAPGGKSEACRAG